MSISPTHITFFFSDSEIALAQTPNKIKNIARGIGIPEDMLELYGEYKAKVYFNCNFDFTDISMFMTSGVTSIKHARDLFVSFSFVHSDFRFWKLYFYSPNLSLFQIKLELLDSESSGKQGNYVLVCG